MTRYLLMIPVLTLLGAAPAAESPKSDRSLAVPSRAISPVPSICRELGSNAQGDRKAPQMRRLGELPSGQAYMAVYRTDDKGCIDPMLASERQR